MEKRAHVEGRFPCAHVRDGTSQLLGQDGQRLALAVLLLQARQVFLPRRMIPEEQHCGFGEGPFELGVADLRPRGPLTLPRRCFRALDQAARGDELLDSWETVAVMNLVEQYQTQELANTWYRAQPIEGVGLVLVGGVDNVELQVAEQVVVVIDQREVDCDALLHGRIGKAFGYALPVGLVGELFADLGQVVLAVGLLAVGSPRCARAPQVHSAPEQVPGRPHRRGIDIGWREHPAAAQHSNLVRIDLVVFRFAAVDRLHVQRMPQDKRHPFTSAPVGEPVPGEETFNRDDEPLPIGGSDLKQRLRIGVHMTVPHDLAILVQDAAIHRAGVQLAPTVKLVLMSVKTHEVSSSPCGFLPMPTYHRGMLRRGPP